MNDVLVVWFAVDKPEKRFSDKHWDWDFDKNGVQVTKKDGSKGIYIPDSNVLYYEIEEHSGD